MYYKAIGVTHKSWVTAHDNHVRDSHLSNEDLGAIPMSTPFADGLMFPGDQNGDAGAGGLVNVNPVFTWVRLAQRIPVHVHIDWVPPDIEIAAGMTCTVNLDTPEGVSSDAWFLLHWLKANLF